MENKKIKTKWLVEKTPLHKFVGKYWILPCISFWYDNDRFLETGVGSPALGFQIFWLNFGWAIVIQKSYQIP